MKSSGVCAVILGCAVSALAETSYVPTVMWSSDSLGFSHKVVPEQIPTSAFSGLFDELVENKPQPEVVVAFVKEQLDFGDLAPWKNDAARDLESTLLMPLTARQSGEGFLSTLSSEHAAQFSTVQPQQLQEYLTAHRTELCSNGKPDLLLVPLTDDYDAEALLSAGASACKEHVALLLTGDAAPAPIAGARRLLSTAASAGPRRLTDNDQTDSDTRWVHMTPATLSAILISLFMLLLVYVGAKNLMDIKSSDTFCDKYPAKGKEF